MVNMTNDGWFGRTSGPYQHLAMYPFRAVEHRIAMVRAANTGISAFIAPSGQIIRHLNLFERGVLSDRVPLAPEPDAVHAAGRLGGVAVAGRVGRVDRGRRPEEPMPGELKRDVAELARQLDELRRHL